MVAQLDKAFVRSQPRKALARIVAWALVEGRPITTRGRWINPIVFAFLRFLQFMPGSTQQERPIYIVGTGRSGTTLLGRIFAAHSNCIFLNEPKALWHYAHGAEDVIGNYSRKNVRLRLGKDDAGEIASRRIAKVYRAVRSLAGAERVVDKYPELVFRTDFANQLFPECYFIGIFRDGVDTCASVANWSQRNAVRNADETHDWWGVEDRKWRIIVEQEVPHYPDLAPRKAEILALTDHRDRAALEWIVSMRALESAAKRHKANFIGLRYEAMCADPQETLEPLLLQLNLSRDEQFLKFAMATLSENPTYGSIELNKLLVEPFCATLEAMGYADSINRVSQRAY